MRHLLNTYILPEKVDASWALKLALSCVVPLAVLVWRPLSLEPHQAAVTAAVLLTIIWWSTGIVKKIPASIFLSLAFCLVSGAGLRTVFAFPLSETFPMIVITYLFSRAISNAGITDRILRPMLLKLVHTPMECLIAIIGSFFLLMYVVPQPLARLIIVAAVFDHFLKKADLRDESYATLMYGVFLFYAVVNMSAKDADMIMNHVAAGFAESLITNGMWVKAMFVPTLAACAAILALFLLIFRRELKGCRITEDDDEVPQPFTTRQKLALVIICATVVLWMTSSLHGLNSTLVTLVATALLFCVGVLHVGDFDAIDITTLVFLTAAFSIGGVMKACGAADKVFGALQGLFPSQLSIGYILIMVLVGILLHMVLGSNTTTLSVVVPGMMILCGGLLPEDVIVYIAIVSVSAHAILPFHSVALMIGSSDGYFPSRYAIRLGVPMTFVIFALAVGVYLPWWRLIGLLG